MIVVGYGIARMRWRMWSKIQYSGVIRFLSFPISSVFGGVGNNSTMAPPIHWFFTKNKEMFDGSDHDARRNLFYWSYVTMVSILWLPLAILNAILIVVCAAMIVVSVSGALISGRET